MENSKPDAPAHNSELLRKILDRRVVWCAAGFPGCAVRSSTICFWGVREENPLNFLALLSA